MTTAKEEPIDLNKLSQRELLIINTKDLKELKQEMKDMQECQQEMKIKMNTIETRGKVWGGVFGFFAGLGTILAEIFIRR